MPFDELMARAAMNKHAAEEKKNTRLDDAKKDKEKRAKELAALVAKKKMKDAGGKK